MRRAVRQSQRRQKQKADKRAIVPEKEHVKLSSDTIPEEKKTLSDVNNNKVEKKRIESEDHGKEESKNPSDEKTIDMTIKKPHLQFNTNGSITKHNFNEKTLEHQSSKGVVGRIFKGSVPPGEFLSPGDVLESHNGIHRYKITSTGDMVYESALHTVIPESNKSFFDELNDDRVQDGHWTRLCVIEIIQKHHLRARGNNMQTSMSDDIPQHPTRAQVVSLVYNYTSITKEEAETSIVHDSL